MSGIDVAGFDDIEFVRVRKVVLSVVIGNQVPTAQTDQVVIISTLVDQIRQFA